MNYGLWIWLLYSVVRHLRINLSIFKRFMNWPWTSSLQWSKRDNSNSSLHNEKSAAYSFTCFKNLIAYIYIHPIFWNVFFFKLGFCQLTLQLKCKQKTNTESNRIYTCIQNKHNLKSTQIHPIRTKYFNFFTVFNILERISSIGFRV